MIGRIVVLLSVLLLVSSVVQADTRSEDFSSVDVDIDTATDAVLEAAVDAAETSLLGTNTLAGSCDPSLFTGYCFGPFPVTVDHTIRSDKKFTNSFLCLNKLILCNGNTFEEEIPLSCETRN